MHTPRFSGQPISAGDLVLETIPSLPIRTSCENVGTVVPRFRISEPTLRSATNKIFASRKPGHYFGRYKALRADALLALSLSALRKTREHTNRLKGVLRIRRDQQETPHALQEEELRSWFRFGEAHSAFRGWRPIPAALLSQSIVLVPGPKNSHHASHPHKIPEVWMAVTARGK